MELKQISKAAIPQALELADHYRLLNEPEQAESICKDVLAIDPHNQLAIRLQLLAITDQFGRRRSANVQHAEEVAARLTDEYERLYYTGVMMERWARAKLQDNQDIRLVLDWIERAMLSFEKAEGIRPAGNDLSVLRWNSCVRLMERLPRPLEAGHHGDFGD